MSYTFDVIVIGGGAAGLTASGIAANLGAKTLLVESDKLGGDCTWTGCVPSKTLLKASKVARSMENASRYGLIDQKPQINFGELMEHVRRKRREVYQDADHPDIFRDMGIDVAEGTARFKDEHTVIIEKSEGETREETSRFIFLATGSRPLIPPISGIQNVNYLTNESIFEISELPAELLVVGAGPIGIEMGQAFNRLGSKVSIIDHADRILKKDDPELTGQLKEYLEGEEIDFYLNSKVVEVGKEGQREGVTLTLKNQQTDKQLKGDRLLVATGRRANVESLHLENAGVEYSQKGIEVDDKCRTSQSHIYACGDVTGRYQFTHMSEHMAKVAVTNALLKIPKKMDVGYVPWCTYTEPELAQVGARIRDLEERSKKFKTYRFPYDKIDRAITESETEGVIKVHAKKGSGKILGVSILGGHAGDMIGEYALAMRQGITMRQISDTIHPYPTYGLGNRRAADQWYVQNQSEWMIKLLQKIFGYRGEIPDLSDPDRIV